MPYIKKTYTFPDGSEEIEKVFSGRYGSRGQPQKKEKPTSEQMEKINIRNIIKKLRRKIKANFSSGYHLVLTYKKNNRPMPEEAKKILENFLRNMRNAYKRLGYEFKYILTTEYENNAIHHHLIVNDVPEVMKLVSKYWTRGHPNFTPLYTEDSYEELAEYLIKETSKTFRTKKVQGKRYTCSKNLVEPECKTEIVPASTFRKEPKPKKGYYIDKSTLCEGINEFGYRYQYYTMIKIKKRE